MKFEKLSNLTQKVRGKRYNDLEEEEEKMEELFILTP